MNELIKTIKHKLIEAELKKVNSTNPYPITGDGAFIHDEGKEYLEDAFGFSLKESDVVIGYEFIDDELRGENTKKEFEEWCKWIYDEFFAYLRGHMELLGYEETDEIDGSGNGLHYGAIKFSVK